MTTKKTSTTNTDAVDASEWLEGLSQHNWTAERLNKITIFVSKTSGNIVYVDENGIRRTIDDPGIEKMLATSRIGSAPERKRERHDVEGKPHFETMRAHGGLWEGREKERVAAIERKRQLGGLQSTHNMPVARSLPYEHDE